MLAETYEFGVACSRKSIIAGSSLNGKYDFSIKISNHLNFNSALIKNVQSSDYQSILRPKDMRLDCTKLKTKIGWVLESVENEVSKIKLR